MKLWKEILIQYALIIVIYNIIVYTDNYGGASNYYFLAFPMTLYMILMPAVIDSINKSNKTHLKKALVKAILPLLFGGYAFLCFVTSLEVSYIYISLMYFIPGLTTLVINLFIAHKQKKNDNFKH